MRRTREDVTIDRPVRVERIPDGTLVELPAGTAAEITQALGSHFTLHVAGQLFRLKGSDADAIGRPVPVSPPASADGQALDLQAQVWAVLKTCYDPEIPVNIVELGLIYDCELTTMEDGRARVAVHMTLTAPGCGMGELLAEEVADKLLELPAVGEANVVMVFDPPWDRSRMSEAALLILGL